MRPTLHHHEAPPGAAPRDPEHADDVDRTGDEATSAACGADALAVALERLSAARDALAEKEQRLGALFEGVSLGLVELDADARIEHVNGRLCELFGYRREELVGKTVAELVAPEDLARRRELDGRLRGGALERLDDVERTSTASGERVWVRVTVSPVRDASGRVVRAVGTIEDVTERRLAEEEGRRAQARLEDLDRRKNEFLAVLSHELRNPLAPIVNRLFVRDRAPPGGPQGRRAREVIERQVGHLTRLVDDLLDVTRISRGKVRLQRERVELGALVARVAEDHRSIFVASEVELTVRRPPGAGPLGRAPTRRGRPTSTAIRRGSRR
jgi:PAS domain S-box-containing protein